jgi:hypothetical protein
VSRRTIAILWIVVGIALWNGFFDLYVSRGAREFLQLRAEFDLGRGPEPAMADVMGRARRLGLIAATLWSTAVVGFGWFTVWRLSRPPALNRTGSSQPPPDAERP